MTDRLKKETKQYQSPPYKISLNELVKYPNYKSLSQIVQKIGEKNVAYVVRSKNPNAPIIVVGPQSHYDMEDDVYTIAKNVYERHGIKNPAIQQFQDDHEVIVNAVNSTNPSKLYLENVLDDDCAKYQITHSGWGPILKKIPHLGLERDHTIDAHAVFSD
ncbi:hypothetical protein HZA38_00015, partial [Candidatus Peregrinibacteria bacterium]|nr:hypothetical protein [Candidatus Peregrinibacteria bacterium]